MCFRFATHKTREATYAISKILEEMNRLDAAALVVQALEDTSEITKFPPPITVCLQISSLISRCLCSGIHLILIFLNAHLENCHF